MMLVSATRGSTWGGRRRKRDICYGLASPAYRTDFSAAAVSLGIRMRLWAATVSTKNDSINTRPRGRVVGRAGRASRARSKGADAQNRTPTITPLFQQPTSSE